MIYQGDSLEILAAFVDDNSIDAIVCDPPYGLSDHSPEDTAACLAAWAAGEEYRPKKKGFMGKTWDSWVPGPEIWRECYRVLKPGGYIVAFAGSRTHDLMSIAMRLAGFECRDTVMWVYGSGFPKSMDVSKAIDKAAGAEREVVGIKANYHSEGKRAGSGENMHGVVDGSFSNPEAAAAITAPATEAAKQWEGWGTALKPAFEPALLFRKPLIGTVAENVLAHGTGALNIDGCRVDAADKTPCPKVRDAVSRIGPTGLSGPSDGSSDFLGRWPANLIHSGEECVTALFPNSNGSGGSVPNVKVTGYGDKNVGTGKSEYFGGERTKVDAGSGSAARFFYCAKANKKDRNEGCEGVQTWENADLNQLTDALKELQKVMSVDTTQPLGDKGWSTSLLGRPTTDPSLPVIKFIIETVSRTTTESRISNYLQPSNTKDFIRDVTRVSTGSGLSLAEHVAHTNLLIQGTTDEKTGSVLHAVNAVLLALSEISKHARQGNIHSTVKPTDLMRYLCRLVTPPAGVVLDPFAGSGSTGKAAILEGFQFIGIEREAEYVEIARARIAAARKSLDL